MVLSILSIDNIVNNNDNDIYDPAMCIERPSPEIASHLTWARGTKNHIRIDNFELSWEIAAMLAKVVVVGVRRIVARGAQDLTNYAIL